MNEVMCFLGWVLATGVGFILGLFLHKFYQMLNVAGVLREDRSDPDSPYLFLELSNDGYAKIRRKKYVVLKVVLENYISAPNTSAGMENTPHN